MQLFVAVVDGSGERECHSAEVPNNKSHTVANHTVSLDNEEIETLCDEASACLVSWQYHLVTPSANWHQYANCSISMSFGPFELIFELEVYQNMY